MDEQRQHAQTCVSSDETQPAKAPVSDSSSLRQKIVEVREKIVETVARMDHLRLQEIPNIQADYAVRIGCWETQLLEAELACRRAKRKLALVRARINQGAEADLPNVEAQLDAELSSWRERVARALAVQYERLGRAAGGRFLNPSETRRLKSVYRTLVKRLHPDLHPNQSEENATLFQIVVRAYEAGQLDVLLALEASTRQYELGDADLDGLSQEELGVALELARVELDIVERKLAELEADPVFEVARNIADAEWVARRVEELRCSIAEFERSRAQYEERLAEILDNRVGE